MKTFIVIFIVIIVAVGGIYLGYRIGQEPNGEEPVGETEEPADVNEDINIAAYQQAKTKVIFPVMHPTYLPEGFKFERSEATEGMGLEFLDYGHLTVTYKDNKGSQIQVLEGSGDVGMVDSLGTVDLSEGEGWLWKAGDYRGISLTSLGTTSYSYVIMTKNVSQDELIKIADSIIGLE